MDARSIHKTGTPLGLKKGGADKVAAFFEAASLPLPQDGDYYNTTDQGRVVFLTPFACTIRVTEKERRFNGEHPHVLKPLFSKAAGDYLIDINPGIETPLQNFQSHEIAFLLFRMGLNIGDPHCNNFGIIPGSSPRFPVRLDLDSQYVKFKEKEIKDLSEATRQVKNLMDMGLTVTEDKTNNPQNQYDGLRALIRKAWPANSNSPRPEDVQEFWLACAKMKKDGKLVSPWEDAEVAPCGTTDAALNYEKKLKSISWTP